ncbi:MULTISPECIES: hypothetical protein [Streptomyces]|uniref:hypothetical protein n=1 Tax=Streptomyces lycopersici TaxID=2974589 RepID=UPI0021D16BF3|nr:hypothetical protein [Streptomyces sp. NEAU-383]
MSGGRKPSVLGAQIHAYHKERLDHRAEGFRTSVEMGDMIFPVADAAVVSARQRWANRQDSGVNASTWVLAKKDARVVGLHGPQHPDHCRLSAR